MIIAPMAVIIACLFVVLIWSRRAPISRPVAALIAAVSIAADVAVTIACQGIAQGADGVANIQQKEMTATIVVSSKSGKRSFRVVLLCDTWERRARGLQGFRRLMNDEAALFVMEEPERATFWMGSVGYPIDIVFIDSSGAVVRAYPGCQPGSRKTYSSDIPVKWVLETAAGAGIEVGDRISISHK